MAIRWRARDILSQKRRNQRAFVDLRGRFGVRWSLTTARISL
jgi:hypothetical protein